MFLIEYGKRRCIISLLERLRWMSLTWSRIILAALVACSVGVYGQPVINELLAVNGKGIRNEQGQTSDWIEIYNPSSTYIDLAGFFLTDDLSRPNKWQFPLDRPDLTRIKPGGFVLVWADSAAGSSALHASFSLASEGEQVALIDPTGRILDLVEFGQQTVDCSFGRSPDGQAQWAYLIYPTPLGPNSRPYAGVVAEPLFSRWRGIYHTGLVLELTCPTDGASILYTTDGTDPSNSRTAKVYTSPLTITKTQPVRAFATIAGWKPSRVVTHTYIIAPSAAIRSLPIISLVGDPGQTFFEPNGVAAIVGGTYVNGVWQSTGPGSYNNILNRDLERPVSFEWILPDGNAIQLDCGLRVHGSNYLRPRYRPDSKFSWRLYFRGEYGPDVLDYPLFPFEVRTFDTIVIRAGHNDMTNPFIKDELVRRLLKDMGHVSSGGTFANLFINGQYKGYYNPCEHIDEHFCQQWFASNKPWDVVTMSGDAREGDRQRWNAFIQQIRQSNMVDQAQYQQATSSLDVVEFIDYLILRLWSGDWDWPQNNWSAGSERSDQGIWRFFVWDAEGAFFSDRLNQVRFAELNSQNNEHGYLYRALKANSGFRRLFADRLQRHFFNNGALTAPHIQQLFEGLRQQMLGVIPQMNNYLVQTWVPQRPAIFFSACQQEGLYSHAGPIFYLNGRPQHGGYAREGDLLTISSPETNAVIYYSLDGPDPAEGWPPTGLGLTKLIDRGYTKRFIVPSGPVDPSWTTPDFDDSTWQTCTGQPGGVGFGRTGDFPIHLSSSIQRQMDGINASCLIRITFDCPVGPEGISALALTIQYDAGFVAYINGMEVARRNFPEGNQPAWNSSATAESADSDAVVFRRMDITSSRSALRAGRNVLAIHGLNSSITDKDFLINAELFAQITLLPLAPGVRLYEGPISLNRSVRVRARSLKDNGISGLVEATFGVGPVAESLRVTELMYHPQDGPFKDAEYIELTNIGTEAIDLAYVRLANAVDYLFEPVLLQPGQYLIVAKGPGIVRKFCDPSATVLGPYSGSLSNSGETVELIDATGRSIQAFTYRDWWYPITDGKGFSLTVMDPATDPGRLSDISGWRPSACIGGSPGWDDKAIALIPRSVIITEVMASPSGDQSDWIELHNTTDKTMDISGWFISDNEDQLTRYRIPAGTYILPHGYLVLYADQSFGKSFGLASTGEKVYLTAAAADIPIGYCDHVSFGPCQIGTSLGRFENQDGRATLVPVSSPTPGTANSSYAVGPIAITELLTEPDTVPDAQFVELTNLSDSPVTLFDQVTGLAWRLSIDTQARQLVYYFPTDQPLTLRPGTSILLTKNRYMLSRQFDLNPRVLILQWDQLGTQGPILVHLSRPAQIGSSKQIYWLDADVAIWSRANRGLSAHRVNLGYGLDQASWTHRPPTPGVR